MNKRNLLAGLMVFGMALAVLLVNCTPLSGTLDELRDKAWEENHGSEGGGGGVNYTAITSVSIQITPPTIGIQPVTTGSTIDTGYTCGSVSWAPNHNPFQGGTEYTATVTLVADSGYSFTGLTSAKINTYDATISNNNGNSVNLAHKFSATLAKSVTSIAINTQPTKISYNQDEKLNLSGLIVTLTYNDASSGNVEFTNFGTYGITTSPLNGITLIRSIHNGQPVIVSQGGFSRNTNNLTVYAPPTVPQGFNATPGNGQVALSWGAPDDIGGVTIIRYEVSSNNGGTWVTASSSTGHTFSSLTNGTNYTFKVRAVNSIGSGAEASRSATPVSGPSVPQNFNAVPGNGQVALSWTAPSDNGGSAITGYQVSSNSGSTWVTPTTNTSHTFTGLSNGTLYTFKVRAVNAISSGAEASKDATPITTPAAPQSFTATPGNTQATLSWAAPSDNGGSTITGYQVSSNNGSTWVAASTSTSHTFTSLTNGTSYTFQVRANNAAGNGTPASTTATPATVPTAPQNFTATAGSGKVDLSWTAPSNIGGSTIIKYEVSNNNGGNWVTSPSATSYTFDSLINNQSYTFQVRAVNSAGNGVAATATATPYAIYAVTFNSNSGTAVSPNPVYVNHGGKVTKPADPTRTNYKFGGWYGDAGLNAVFDFDNTTITTDRTIYAKWLYTFTVVYNANRSTTGAVDIDTAANSGGSMSNTSFVESEAQALRAIGFTTRGHDFEGWAESSTGSVLYQNTDIVTLTSTAGGTKNLYAKWKPRTLPSSTTIVDGLTWINTNALTDKEYTINVNANDSSFAPRVFSTGTGFTSYKIILTSSSGSTVRYIDLSSNGRMFTISDGITLELKDNIYLRGRSGNNNSLVAVTSGGTLLMTGNSSIRGNSNTSSAAGVMLVTNATFIMKAGEIYDNTSESTSGSTYGAGVYVADNTKFTLDGGTIKGNKVISDRNCYGGGVYVAEKGSFTMLSGTITSNTAQTTSTTTSYASGGGVCTYNAFTMESGVISNNTVSGGSGGYGGGIFSSSNNGSNNPLAIKGGTISYNTSGNQGGGIYIVSVMDSFSKTGQSNFDSYSSGGGNRALSTNGGHAVYAEIGYYPGKIRRMETQVGAGVNLDTSSNANWTYYQP